MQVSIPNLIRFIQAQPTDRLTSTALWDPCVLADYIRETTGIAIPRRSDSLELGPFKRDLRKSAPDYEKIVDILSNPSMPDTYGNLLTFVVAEFPKAAELLQTANLV